MTKHTPVLLQQAIDGLNVKPGGRYIDATFGLGGHSREILKKGGNVLAIDWNDQSNIETRLIASLQDKRLTLIIDNYCNIEKIAKENDFYPADGILFDLVLSMEQVAISGRGFSYQKPEEELDMRINKELKISASDILNNYTKEELYEIFTTNAETINIGSVIDAIIRRRRVKKFQKVVDILKIIDHLEPNFERNSIIKRQVFQALRMEVNQELDNIRKAIIGSSKILISGGRLAIISFHQTEDRLIKTLTKQSDLKIITKKPIISKQGKYFERSAKLRIYEKN